MGINRIGLDSDKFVFGTVEGGDKADPSPMQNGLARVRETASHGRLVQTDHLKFVQQIVPSSAQHETPRPPRPGQVVQLLKTNDGYSYITGIAMGIAKSASGTFDALVPQIRESIQKTTGMNVPPNVQTKTESNRTGLEKTTHEVIEKGEEDRHELYNGLPSHGAAPSMAGLINNPVQQVTTAMTEMGSVLTSSLLSQIPGTLFSAANFLSALTANQQSDLFGTMPAEMQTAMTNLMTLKQGYSGGSMPGNYMLGGTVNPSTFIPQMIERLKGVTDFNSLDSVVHGMTSASLSDSAREGLPTLSLNVTGLFGDLQMSISANGSINTVASDAMNFILSAFQSLVTTIPSAQGQMFGANSNLPTMINRLRTSSASASAKANLEGKHPDQSSQRTNLANGNDSTLGSKSFFA